MGAILIDFYGLVNGLRIKNWQGKIGARGVVSAQADG